MKFTVENQELVRTDSEKIIADSTGIVKVSFTLGEIWKDKLITAFFCNGGEKKCIFDIKNDTEYIVPWEVLKVGNLHISLEGVGDGVTIFTKRARPVRVYPSGRTVCASVTNAVTPGVFEQMCNKFDEVKDSVLLSGPAFREITLDMPYYMVTARFYRDFRQVVLGAFLPSVEEFEKMCDLGNNYGLFSVKLRPSDSDIQMFVKNFATCDLIQGSFTPAQMLFNLSYGKDEYGPYFTGNSIQTLDSPDGNFITGVNYYASGTWNEKTFPEYKQYF